MRFIHLKQTATRTVLSILTLACMTLAVTGCGQPFWLPPAHKIEVQQGNLVSPGQRDRMQVGMSREDIIAIAGEPVVGNAFHADRWDYMFTRGPAGAVVTARSVTVTFADNKVAALTDNYDQESGEIPIQRYWWQRVLNRSLRR
ncbi:MAG: outer membrane protein assembly factor BamE [Gammaproteobacteria bacterium]|nr:outer membrane protein assembly factor BamE [Gammaproteobacteria bacterium]